MAEFNMYTAKVSELGNTIADNAAKYLAKIDEVTALVNNLSSVWGGPTYDTFKASYDSNLGNLEELNTILREMASNVSDTAEAGEKMINEINSLME